MELVTVGTGTVAPSASRTSACHWVSRGRLKILLDCGAGALHARDRKSTRLNSSHVSMSYAVFCLKKKKTLNPPIPTPVRAELLGPLPIGTEAVELLLSVC